MTTIPLLTQPETDARPALLDWSLDELTATLGEWGWPAFRARQVWEWVYRHYVDDFEQMTNLPAALRQQLAEAHDAATAGTRGRDGFGAAGYAEDALSVA